MTVHNYYETLGLASTSTDYTIKAAIREMRKRYRQIAGSPNKEQARNAEVIMERLAEAEKVFSSAESRRAFDLQLVAVPAPQALAPAPTGGGAGETWVERAKDYLANGSPRNAAQAAKQATVAEPSRIDAWTVRAYSAIELKDFTDADFSAREALRLDPSNPQIVGLLGDVCNAEGRYPAAEEAFARAAVLEPDQPYWQHRVAWALSAQGRVEEAINLARRVVENFPGDDRAQITYGNMLIKGTEAVRSREGNTLWFTNVKQIKHAEALTATAERLQSSDRELVEWINITKKSIAEAKRRRYAKLHIFRLLFAIIFLFSGFGSFAGSPGGGLFWLVVAGLMGWWWWARTFVEQWKLNKRAVGPVISRTGLQ